jgi:GH15 family glucan-1,4-alpha-glucosidase
MRVACNSNVCPTKSRKRQSSQAFQVTTLKYRMAQRIEDYALIGDCHTAALVGRNGSIDWLYLPRFDSPACFASLIVTEANGRWQIAPGGQIRQTQRRYRQDTLILETDIETAIRLR